MKKENRLLTIDGETLMSQPLTPLNFVVDTLLSQGLHILAGSPKVGKSWLALWLAVMVAKGDPVWGMGVKQGTTLYLCLEDSTLRIQNRLFEITEDAPASVHFTTNSDTLGKGLEEQLRAFLSEHPDTVLVINDTLQMIRGTGYDNTYANDYRDLSALKRIADAHGIAILLVHHLRKELADDVFSRISGTTAISGAVDSSFTLVEDKRGSGKAKLSCIGRDIEYRELTLERNTENVWELVSDTVVVEEDGVHRSKKPDYSFKVGTEVLYFLETKKPAVNLTIDAAPAFQLRRYGWSGNLKVSVLTNFTDLYIYDCSVRPREGDDIGIAMIAHYHFDEYVERFEEIYNMLSKEAVLTGQFERHFGNIQGALRREPFDQYFLDQIRTWRMMLGEDIHKSSPLLSKKSMSANIGAQQEMLEKAEQASVSLFALWDNDANPLCIEVLKNINASGLYELTERTNDILDENYVGDDPKVIALKKALSVPFDEMERYATYVSDSSRFATHQGVKGLEFPRVMVILDDTESRGFLFSYEKLFGAKKQTATDLKNEKEGKDTSNRRTARLFYVACTRAMESLAVVAYSDNPELVKNTALNNGWFSEDEIQIIETQSVL